METPGQTLRRLRKALDLTQKQLAARCHLEQFAISRYESGAKGITESRARSFAKALGCPVESFRPELGVWPQDNAGKAREKLRKIRKISGKTA